MKNKISQIVKPKPKHLSSIVILLFWKKFDLEECPILYSITLLTLDSLKEHPDFSIPNAFKIYKILGLKYFRSLAKWIVSLTV